MEGNMKILSKVFYIKVSVIGLNGTVEQVYGKPKEEAKYKVLEVGAALLTFGFRATVMI
jgi:hypothetical protein